MRAKFACLCSMALLTACGGGGNSNSDSTPDVINPAPSLSQATISRAKATVNAVSQSFYIIQEESHLSDLIAYVGSNTEEDLDIQPNDDDTMITSKILEENSCGGLAEYKGTVSIERSEILPTFTLEQANVNLDTFCLNAGDYENVYSGELLLDFRDRDLLGDGRLVEENLHIKANYRIDSTNPSYPAEETINIAMDCNDGGCSGDVTVDEEGETVTLVSAQFFERLDENNQPVDDTVMITGLIHGFGENNHITAEGITQCDSGFLKSGFIDFGRNRYSTAASTQFTITFDGCDYFTIEENGVTHRLPFTDLSHF